jgi:hypothetical protein
MLEHLMILSKYDFILHHKLLNLICEVITIGGESPTTIQTHTSTARALYD